MAQSGDNIDGLVFGEAGNDRISVTWSGLPQTFVPSYVDGGIGNDRLLGHGTVIGGSGSDVLSGSGMLFGGAGDDQLNAFFGSALIRGRRGLTERLIGSR